MVNTADVAFSTQKKYVIPPDAPVLPTLASQCGCQLRVSETGSAMVIYDEILPDDIHWAEYDVDLQILTFVTWSGKVMGLGLKIHDIFQKSLKKAEQIVMVSTSKDGHEVYCTYLIDLVVRHTGI